MEIIKKLQDKKIFKENSLVGSTIEKNWMGSPEYFKSILILIKNRLNV